jgi:hypothetical protein
MRLSIGMTLLIALLWAAPLAAQDDDVSLSQSIEYDSVVGDTLTARAFWDWWFLQAAEGEQIVVEMAGADGLAPLIGILDSRGNLVARSADGEPNTLVTVEYTIPADGEYVLVATRAGNENGTTTGSYTLRVRRVNEAPQRPNPYQEVRFRCQDYEVTNAAVIQFVEDPEQAEYYMISVYGLDGFQPVIRVVFDAVDLTDCARDWQAMQGNQYTLPGADPVSLDDPDQYRDHAAQLLIGTPDAVGMVTLTIGSADGAPGRFVAVIDGFVLSAGDRDRIRLGQGPLAASAPLTLYMIAHPDTRLDPALALLPEGTPGLVCDDAGRRGCVDVPSPVGLSLTNAVLERTLTADAFDAGLVLPRGATELRLVELYSFNNRASGGYALALLGELPPRP